MVCNTARQATLTDSRTPRLKLAEEYQLQEAGFVPAI
jgi:hypothetical protein